PDNTVQINMSNNTLFAKNIVLKKDRQQIEIGTNTDNNLLKITFDDVKLEELISGFMPILKSFKGELTGEVEVANAITKPTPIGNLKISSIEFDNEEIGNLMINSSFENEILKSKLILAGERISMSANGIFDANQGVDSLHAKIQINRINLSFMNKYFKDLIYGMEGDLKANILIDGKINQLSSSGSVYIDTLSTYVNNIHTRFTTSKQTVVIIPDKFVFSDFEFRDEFGNPAVANGIISHNYFQNFFLNISASTPKLFCLNTTSQNNQYFYGRVFAKADMNFKGTIGDRITISANGSNLPNSHIYIAFGGNKNADKYSFYDFVSKTSSTDSSLNTKRVRRGGVNFDFNFDINDKGNLTIIMDPAVDDRIDCTGEGKISLKMSPETDMDIYGSYVVNSGNYKFTYQNLIERTFNINKGGSM
ncbi:MAG: translocation/assembly module TamB domain-containing protein, partial [Chitinophagales bacterium]